MKEIIMPKFDVNDNDVTIVEIYVENGSYINKGDKIMKAESTKMVREIISEDEGYIKLYAECFDVKKNGDIVAAIYDTKEEVDNNSSHDNNREKRNVEINATAKAISLAKQLNVDLSELAQKKNGGIIKTADVEAYAENHKKKTNSASVHIMPAINVYDRERVLIIGAGQMSEQIIDIMLDDKDKYVVGLVDSYKTEYTSYNCPLFTCDVFKFDDVIDKSYYDTVIISIGGDKKSMLLRQKLYKELKDKGIRFTNAIGDNVNIRRAVNIGENNIITHNCYIGTGAHIGNNNVISYGSCIGHHNNIGSHNLFAPGFMAAGNVNVGDNNIIMTGVNVISFASIGNNVILPVGYNVMQDIPDGTNLLNK